MNKNRKIQQLLTRGVVEILPDKAGLEKLMSQRKIRIYTGIDPTAKNLHLGHAVNLRRLQKFAELGHEVILVVGTGTVLAGDPSQREDARPKISETAIKENIKNWKEQLGKVLDLSKVKIKYNGDWLLDLGYKDIMEIASNISAAKIFQRDMFQERLKKGKSIWTHEFLYPLFQGYDSVVLDIDLEIGGTDQTFNMLIGRELMRKMRGKEKFVMTLKMILGVDGYPMSKTRGNCIWLTDSSKDMYGKIMSMPDALIFEYFEMLTDIPLKKIKAMPPRMAKARLAREMVEDYHGRKAAVAAEKEFERVFKEKKLPSQVPQVALKGDTLNILELLVKVGLASSKSIAKRLVGQGGVKIDGEIWRDWRGQIKVRDGTVVQVGKRKFIKIRT